MATERSALEAVVSDPTWRERLAMLVWGIGLWIGGRRFRAALAEVEADQAPRGVSGGGGEA